MPLWADNLCLYQLSLIIMKLVLSPLMKVLCTNLLCQHPTSIAEVKKLIIEMKFDELRQMMMPPLSFGTAGNRYTLFDGLTL